MPVALPGKRVRGSHSGRPIMAALDLLGRRWTLRALWELRHGPLTFRALREACDEVSPTVLNLRLRELKQASIVQSGTSGYTLTRSGAQLCAALAPLQKWASRWAKEIPS